MIKIEDLKVFYGEIKAIRGITLYVKEGELVSVVGANGAGKSTLLRTIMGLKTKEEGNLFFREKEFSHLPAYKRARMGMSLIPEGGRVFPKISVYDNLVLGAYKEKVYSKVKERLEYVFSIFPRLAERKEQMAGTLSGGERQMLAIGRALMGDPSFLMIDEISLGLMPILVDTVFEVIDRLHKENGLTILLAEQNAQMATEVSDRVYILELGHIVKEGSAKEIANDPHIKKAYLGY